MPPLSMSDDPVLRQRHWGPATAAWISRGPPPEEHAASDEHADPLEWATGCLEFISEEELVTVCEEFVAMDRPFLTLAVMDRWGQNLVRDDFRRWNVEAVAALLLGENDRALACLGHAQRVAPSEPSIYTNVAQVYLEAECVDQAWAWIDAGLAQTANHPPLWQTLHQALAQGLAPESKWASWVADAAHKHHSWLGTSLLASLTTGGNSQTLATLLEPFYTSGERSEAFLLEYSGALGVALRYETLVEVVLLALQPMQEPPWRLEAHLLEGLAALGHREAFFARLKSFRRRTGVDPEAVARMDALGQDATIWSSFPHP